MFNIYFKFELKKKKLKNKYIMIQILHEKGKN